MRVVRFHASDWLRNEINRRVRRARHQGRVSTTASDVIRGLLRHAIAAERHQWGRSRRALKARTRRRRRASALEDLQKAGPNDGQEKESVAVLAGAAGGPILQIAERNRELPTPGEDS